MELTEKKQDGVLIIGISGRLDSNTSPEFEERLFGLIREGDKNLVLDFDTLDYISSAGLRVLLKAVRELKTQEGKLVLCAMKDYIQEVFDLSGFVSVFPIATTMEMALGEFE